MAISFYPISYSYIGLSTDDKSALNQEGAKIYYTDTKNTQINHGGVWYDYNDSTKLTGSLANNQTNTSVTANTNILTTNYTPSSYQNSKLVVGASVSGVPSVVIDGVALTLNSGMALVAGAAYAFDVPLMAGSTYNLQYSQACTMQVKWQVI